MSKIVMITTILIISSVTYPKLSSVTYPKHSLTSLLLKHFLNYVSLHYEILFLMDDFVKKSYIPMKNLCGYKLVRATKLSELIIWAEMTQELVQNESHEALKNYLCHLMNGSRFVRKSRKKANICVNHYVFRWMKTLIVFLFYLYFCRLRNFVIIRCIVKLLIVIQHVFVKCNWKKKTWKVIFERQSLGAQTCIPVIPVSQATWIRSWSYFWFI